MRFSNDGLSTRISAAEIFVVTFPRQAFQFEAEVADGGISFNPHSKLVSRLQSYRISAGGPPCREKQDSSRECNYVCTMRYALVLEMHWRLGANHSPRRRGVSGAVWRNILPPAGRRSCRPTDPVVGPIPAVPLFSIVYVIALLTKLVKADLGISTDGYGVIRQINYHAMMKSRNNNLVFVRSRSSTMRSDRCRVRNPK